MSLGDNLRTEGILLVDKVKDQMNVKNIVRYIVEGVAVAIAAYVIPNRKTDFSEVATIAMIASLSLFVLDLFSSDVARGSRLGAGFGIGYNLIADVPGTLPFM